LKKKQENENTDSVVDNKTLNNHWFIVKKDGWVYNIVKLILKILRFIKNKIIAILFIIFEIIIPKNKKTIIIAHGDKYNDNCKYFFEYCMENSNILECYWLTRNYDIAKRLKNTFFNRILYTSSIKSLWLFLRSKNVVISHGSGDVKPYYLTSLRKNVINLWHGFPLKRIGLLYEKTKNKKFIQECKKYRFMVSSSEIESYIFASAFNMNVDNIWITGSPRIDNLSNKDDRMLEKHSYLKKIVILYAPTWHKELGQTIFFPFNDFDISGIVNLLEKYDAYILLRGHVNDFKDISTDNNFKNCLGKRIISANYDVFPDVYGILSHVNIVITDYSSIYIDFLLMDKPVFFIPYDYKDYEKCRGFTLDYHRFTPGPKIYSQKDFIKTISNYIKNSHIDSDKRKNIRDLLYKYIDFQNCQRLLNKICEINKMKLE